MIKKEAWNGFVGSTTIFVVMLFFILDFLIGKQLVSLFGEQLLAVMVLLIITVPLVLTITYRLDKKVKKATNRVYR